MDYCHNFFTNVTYKFLQYYILCEGVGIELWFCGGVAVNFFFFRVQVRNCKVSVEC